MKRILLALLTVLTYAVPSWADVEINETNFPDATFRDYVGKKSNKIDKDGNGTLTDEEIASVTSLAVNGKKIASLKGVEFFTALTELKCHNNQLTSLDLSKNTALTTLWCYQNQIRGDEMNALIASLPSVTEGTLRITYSQEKSESNLCTTTNVEAAKAKGWSVYNNTGTEFAGLVILCTINETSFPDETFRTYVASTSVDGNQDGILTETEATKLTKIDMSGKGVTSLKGIEYFTAITTLYCYTNQLTSLDVSKNTALKTFYFYGNQIKSTAMEALIASLPTVSSGTIRVINVDDENEGNVCTESQVSTMKEKGWSSVKYCVGNSWQDYTGVLPIKIDETNFPDANFRAFVASSSVDTNTDGILTSKEIGYISTINVAGKEVSNLQGIEFFTSLKSLDCSNNRITTLDLSRNSSVNQVTCHQNQISGENLNSLIASLPNLEDGKLRLISTQDERNACTAAQVEAAKAKGWEVQLRSVNSSGTSWEAFTGVMPIEVNETNFPDANFRTVITNSYGGYDGYITEQEIKNTTEISLYGKNISDLKGIEFFTALTYLSCGQNNLTTIDLSKNTLLKQLYCSGNQLTTLNVSENTALTALTCSDNQLTTLDLSKNTALSSLNCSNNKLSTLNVSNTSLSNSVYIYQNQLKGDAMNAFIAGLPEVTSVGLYIYNPNEENEGNIIGRKMVKAAKEKGWTAYIKNSQNTWVEYAISIDENLFPDEVFRARVSSSIDKDGNGTLSDDEIERVTKITIYSSDEVHNLKGIELFTELTELESLTKALQTIDITQNIKLQNLRISNSTLTTIDLSNNIALTDLSLSYNQLTSLDLSKNTALSWLECSNNQLTSLNLPKNTILYWLDCGYNQLTSLDVTKNTALTNLYCSGNQLSSLDVTKNTTLTHLGCSGNQLSSLDVTKNTALTSLDCSDNQLSSLDVTKNTALTELDCYGDQLTALDLSKNTALTSLYCSDNQLTYLILSGCTALHWVKCGGNKFAGEYTDELVKNLPSVSEGKLYFIEGTNDDNFCTKAQVSDANAKGWTVYRYGAEFDGYDDFVDVTIDSSHFPDEVFRSYISEEIDKDGDGILSVQELSSTTNIEISYYLNGYLHGITDIKDLKGIEYFTELTWLRCPGNQLTSLDLSKNQALYSLDCSGNQLTSLDLSKNTGLYSLDCSGNQLTSLDLSKNESLLKVDCSNNQLTSLVFGSDILSEINCSENKIVGTEMNAMIASIHGADVKILNRLNHKEGNVFLANHSATLTSRGLKAYNYVGVYGYTPENEDDSLNGWELYNGYSGSIEDVKIDAEHFPDDNFRAYIAGVDFDKNQDGVLSAVEYSNVGSIIVNREGYEHEFESHLSGVGSIEADKPKISSLKGLEYFPELTLLSCYGNSLTSLDLSQNKALTAVFCGNNMLGSLDLSNNSNLITLCCPNDNLTSLDLSNCPKLEAVYCYDNRIKGSQMDDLIASLPYRSNKRFCAYNTCDMTIYGVSGGRNDLGNIITASQVLDAKKRGWTTYIYEIQNGWYDRWYEYAGSDADLSGDVNGDGNVNAADIVEAVNLIKTGGYDKAADLNNDGKVDGTDVDAITKIIMTTK